MLSGRRRGNFGLMLLFLELMQFGFDRIPPVTLGAIAFNVAVFLGIVHPLLNRKYPHPLEICVGVNQVWPTGEYWRILEATFYHADDFHLYYNMVSFLWKAKSLEKHFGSAKFLYMLALFSVLVNTVLLYLNYGAAILFKDPSYLQQCAVGFSGVVFAVKVVTTQLLPRGTTLIMGAIPVNTRWSCWLELLLIQILVPNASFTGHLAGILVGLAFTNTPLKAILDWPFPDNARRNQGQSYTYYRGTTGYYYDDEGTENFSRYTGGLSENEQMRFAMERSLNDQQNFNEASPQPSAPPFENGHRPSPYGGNLQPTPEELRRRRLERYDHSSR